MGWVPTCTSSVTRGGITGKRAEPKTKGIKIRGRNHIAVTILLRPLKIESFTNNYLVRIES